VGSLSSDQNAILIGSLLGDGTLRRQNNRLNALFEMNHSYKQREYVDWKWQYFHRLVLTPPKFRIGAGNRIAYRFTTQSLPEFTKYHNWFYINGKKRIPFDIELNPLSLAVWFMDDGTKIRSAIYLNTQQFSIEEQQFLQRLMFKVFKLNCTLNRDKKYFRLRVDMVSSTLMSRIIDPYVIQSMKYKLTNDPVTTESKDEILTVIS
jgi:hypothetical protein